MYSVQLITLSKTPIWQYVTLRIPFSPPLVLRLVSIVLYRTALSQSSSQKYCLSFWSNTDRITPYIQNMLVKTHSAFCIFSVTCHAVLTITVNCFYGQHLLCLDIQVDGKLLWGHGTLQLILFLFSAFLFF